MFDKNEQRLRRSRQTRLKIRELCVGRLAVHRTNQHIYASVFDEAGVRILVTASTAEKEVREQLAGKNGSNIEAAKLIGERVARKALAAGIAEVAFDRGGFRYHGRVKALAEAAREAGLKF